MVPEYEAQDIREVIEKPYRLIYRVKSDQMDVLAVVHSAQLLPAKLWGNGDMPNNLLQPTAKGGGWARALDL